MNILFDINHPGHVHLFKNAIHQLKEEGHRIVITSRDKDITVTLLNNYQMDHILLSKAAKGLFWQACELVTRQLKLIPILLKHKIDVCVSVTGACNVHICKLLGIPTIVFYDTEHATLQNKIALPFVKLFITPESFQQRYGSKHITYKGTHDLAYLHPNYFVPNKSIYKALKLSEDEKYIILRFVSWEAIHDRGQKGISPQLKQKILDLCSQHAKVYISSEAPLSQDFLKYQFPLSPEKMHDALNFASLYIGEGGSMTTEAAILGTPAILISTLTAGVFEEYEKKYDLMYHFTPDQETLILEKIQNLLESPDSKTVWKDRKKKFLQDKEDLTRFMISKILSIK